jgi:hypothetical protein
MRSDRHATTPETGPRGVPESPGGAGRGMPDAAVGGSLAERREEAADPAPSSLRSVLYRKRRQVDSQIRLVTSPLRMLPDSLVIGAQKAGTTSLFHYLVRHPRVLAPPRKEIGFFTANWQRGLDWYRWHFPLRRPGGARTLEASTGYLDQPYVPARVAQVLPQARFLVLMRDPLERAWSHWRHSVRLGVEQLSFADALAAEEERLAPLFERMGQDESYHPRELSYYTYQRRGRYAEHLENWFRFFPRERFLILPSEQLYRRPGATMEGVWRFLELPDYRDARYEAYNSSAAADKRGGMDAGVRRRLREYFEPHNERLERLLGLSLDWS